MDSITHHSTILPRPAINSQSNMASRSVASRGRREHAVISYRESSSDTASSSEATASDMDEDLRASKRLRRDSRNHTANGSRTSRSVYRNRTRTATRSNIRANTINPTPLRPLREISSDSGIPAWPTLPYEILLSIFSYASYPLQDEFYRPTESISWLLQTARLCRAFTEPALSALYETPPLLTSDKPHRLLEMLHRRQRNIFNYAAKIRNLDLDLNRTLAYSSPGWGNFDLRSLVKELPNLKTIDISLSANRPPFRNSYKRVPRWFYDPSLFDCLSDSEIKLRRWRWNEELLLPLKSLQGHVPSIDFDLLHLTHAAFHRLHHLTLSGFHKLFTATHQPAVAAIIAQLDELYSLEFESCQCDRWPILRDLPSRLRELAFINCNSLSSRELGPFLTSHGHGIKVLTLNHNRALDLSFLAGFKKSCPHLEVFRADCNLYSALENSTSSEPEYDYVLKEGEIPTWPSTLQVIEMLHVRKWTSDTAATFFDSLLASSEDLPYLQELTLKVILDIGWRDRAGFRETRINDLQRVFLKHRPPPNEHLVSKKAYRDWKTESRNRQNLRVSKRNHQTDGNKPTGGSCHTVDITIDNLRPREVQFHESDFMDSERSGDEEWANDNDVME